jgi:SurA N-terminal domain
VRAGPVLLVVLGTVGLTACGSLLAPPAAVVNGHSIGSRKLAAALDDFEKTPQFAQAAQQSSSKAIARQFEQSYLALLIRRDVLERPARRLGISVTSSQVQRAVAKLKQRFATQQAFDNALQQQGLTLAQLEKLVRDRVLEEKLRAKVTAGLSRTRADRAWQRWLIDAYRGADVKVNPRYGVLDLKTQTITDSSASFPGAAARSPASSPLPAAAPTG